MPSRRARSSAAARTRAVASSVSSGVTSADAGAVDKRGCFEAGETISWRKDVWSQRSSSITLLTLHFVPDPILVMFPKLLDFEWGERPHEAVIALDLLRRSPVSRCEGQGRIDHFHEFIRPRIEG